MPEATFDDTWEAAEALAEKRGAPGSLSEVAAVPIFFIVVFIAECSRVVVHGLTSGDGLYETAASLASVLTGIGCSLVYLSHAKQQNTRRADMITQAYKEIQASR